MDRRYPEAMQLTAIEARVLGSLIEKEITTPEYYPLSLNALVNASNQKSSREPVMQLTEREVETALRSLENKDLVSVDHGSRVERYENRARTVFHLRRDETAVLCLLLLRGAQTPGELRSRADRLFQFDDIAAVISALDRMSRPSEDGTGRKESLVAIQPRQPGSREQRYQQLLSEAAPKVSSAPADGESFAETNETTQPGRRAGMQDSALQQETMARIAALEAAIESLQRRLSHLERQLGESARPG